MTSLSASPLPYQSLTTNSETLQQLCDTCGCHAQLHETQAEREGRLAAEDAARKRAARSLAADKARKLQDKDSFEAGR